MSRRLKLASSPWSAADAGFRRGGGGGGGGGGARLWAGGGGTLVGGGGGHACGRGGGARLWAGPQTLTARAIGGMGERCELPHRGLGQSPRSQRFLRFKTFQNYV